MSDDVKTSLDDLPFELLEIIMSYLNSSDRREMSLVSKRLAKAADNVSKISVTFDYCRFDDSYEPLFIFSNPSRHYKLLSLGENIEFGLNFQQFCGKIGETLTHLTLEYCPGLTMDILISILKHMKCLEELKIMCRKEFFLDGIDNFNSLTESLKNIKRLLINGTNITNIQFKNFVKLLPNLESMSLYFCKNSLDPPKIGHFLNSQDVVDFLEERKDKLKILVLDDFGYKILAGQQLLEVLQSLKLRKLFLPSSGNGTFLETYLNTDQKLLALGMTLNSNECFIVANKLPHLEELIIKDISNERLENLDFLKHFENLIFFRLLNYNTSFTFVQGDHELHNLSVMPSLKYFELNYSTKICHPCLHKITESFPNLMILKLRRNDIDDDDLQLIFKNLKLLRKLCLSGCQKITDTGMIGWRQSENSEWKSIQPEFSLLNLKGLRTLDVSGCSQITNLSLFSVFQLRELRKVRIGDLKKISQVGIEALAQNCSSIEVLDVGGCDGVTDNCIKTIAKNLKRLKWLDVHGCKALSDVAWQHLENYSRLQVLNCWNCNFTIFLRDTLFSRIKSLKLLYYEQKVRRFDYEEHQRLRLLENQPFTELGGMF